MSDTTQPAVPTTEADKIWAEIQNKPILMFSLPNQIVANYCTQAKIDPSRCFLQYKAAAVIPALEEAIGKGFTVEAVDKYIVVSRAVPLFPGLTK
jgi:hypothetical protein